MNILVEIEISNATDEQLKEICKKLNAKGLVIGISSDDKVCCRGIDYRKYIDAIADLGFKAHVIRPHFFPIQ